MKEIAKRLHENRQIQLAKEILESNGYKVSKINESEQDEVYSIVFINASGVEVARGYDTYEEALEFVESMDEEVLKLEYSSENFTKRFLGDRSNTLESIIKRLKSNDRVINFEEKYKNYKYTFDYILDREAFRLLHKSSAATSIELTFSIDGAKIKYQINSEGYQLYRDYILLLQDIQDTAFRKGRDRK